MKSMGLHVVRGEFLTGQRGIKIQIDDRDPRTGYKIVDFKVAFKFRNDINPESCSAKIMTYEAPPSESSKWEWADSREVAWAYGFSDANTSVGADHHFTVVDPSNLLVEDVYLQGYSYADGEVFNYMIVFEKFELDPFDGPLTMVRNRSD